MEEVVTLDYGSGGKKTAAFIKERIVPAFANEALQCLGDGAVVSGAEQMVFSTDSFVVDPVFFPGGDIGKLSVCGTVNDLAMAGGLPQYLSFSLILEEGFPLAMLDQILESVRVTAEKAKVQIVTGDTKVVEKGRGDKIYINTAGIGKRVISPGLEQVTPGDVVILSGAAGDHGAAIMMAREEFHFGGTVQSDCALIHEMAQGLFQLGKDLKILRDPTRGGVATTLNEFAEDRNWGIRLEEQEIPVHANVKSVCDLLGLDPLYCANEGKLLAIVSESRAQEALRILKTFPEGQEAAVIGTVAEDHPGKVLLNTRYGTRILSKLSGAQLPRIC